MKKLLQVSAVLLAAVLMFAGCKNNADEGGDDLPGKWKSELSFYNDQTTDKRTGALVTCDGSGGVIVQNANPEQPDSTNPIKENGYRTNLYTFASDINLTGFEATAKNTSSYSTYGFCFNISDDWSDMYQIDFEYSGFIIYKCIDSNWDKVCDWTQNKAIKAEPAENTITVYKDNADIIIKANGTTLYTIKNAEATSGRVGFTTAIGYEDIQNGTSYTITYKLKQAQYEE